MQYQLIFNTSYNDCNLIFAIKYFMMIGCKMRVSADISRSGKGLKLLIVFLAIVTFVSFNCPAALHAKESSCVSCHTSIKKILEELRALEASKPKVKKSAESAGEG